MEKQEKSLEYWMDDPTLTDFDRVAKWLEHQESSKIFELLVETLRKRITLFEQYSRVVRNNALYNLCDSDNPRSKADLECLSRCRNKILGGLPIDKTDYEKCFEKHNIEVPTEEEFTHRYMDGGLIIETINEITK